MREEVELSEMLGIPMCPDCVTDLEKVKPLTASELPRPLLLCRKCDAVYGKGMKKVAKWKHGIRPTPTPTSGKIPYAKPEIKAVPKWDWRLLFRLFY